MVPLLATSAGAETQWVNIGIGKRGVDRTEEIYSVSVARSRSFTLKQLKQKKEQRRRRLFVLVGR